MKNPLNHAVAALQQFSTGQAVEAFAKSIDPRFAFAEAVDPPFAFAEAIEGRFVGQAA